MAETKRRWTCITRERSDNLLKTILNNRGITKHEEFINPKLSSLNNFSEIKDVDKGITIVQKAIKDQKTIVIYHDYDADGIGGGAVALLMLKELGAKVTTYANNRFTQGYGMCISGIDEIIEKYGKNILIITIDNGITQNKEVEYLNDLGVDVIITDHHNPDHDIPLADAIINPKLKDNEEYPFRELCGAGVIWRFLSQLYPNKEEDTKKYLDIVAVSTVADVVPLLGENRIIVSKGLKIINSKDRMVFRLLSELTETEHVNSYTLGFQYGPIINAIGRLKGDVSDAITALTTDNEEVAREILSELVEINNRRKEITNEQLEKAEKTVESLEKLPSVIVIYDQDFHQGVVGLIAGRLTEKYNRPTIVLGGNSNGYAKGSGRSIEAFDLFTGLQHINKSNILSSFGGHPMAAGMSININDIEYFKHLINEYANSVLTEEDFIKVYEYEAQITTNDLNIALVENLELLEPYGEGFPKPLFKIINFHDFSLNKMGSDNQHLSIKNHSNVRLICWNYAETVSERIKNKNSLQALGFPEINEWKGFKNIQFIINKDNIF